MSECKIFLRPDETDLRTEKEIHNPVTIKQRNEALSDQFCCVYRGFLCLCEKQAAGGIPADKSRSVQRGFPDFCAEGRVNSQYCDLCPY